MMILKTDKTNAHWYWEYAFDTTMLQDGYYVILAKAMDEKRE